MAGTPKRRARRQAAKLAPKYPELVAIYAEKWDSFDAMRAAMVKHGIVEHGISPYDVIQRAIDDCTTDYLLLRKQIAKDTDGQKISAQLEHPLYDHMEHMRECMVRFSTFAAQYNLEARKVRLSETRVAVLSNTLRTVLENLAIDPDVIRQVPAMLIEQLQRDENANAIDANKAEALAEILHYDSEVEILDAEPSSTEPHQLERPSPARSKARRHATTTHAPSDHVKARIGPGTSDDEEVE